MREHLAITSDCLVKGERPLEGADEAPHMLPACPGGPVLIYALSGMGKSTLAARYPTQVLDADEFLYAAVAEAFPDVEPRARLRAWRDLCRLPPWTAGADDLRLWARTRRAWVEPFVAAMRGGEHRLVVTSVLNPPWVVGAYYGVESGRYLEHLAVAGRAPDNRHTEAMNERLAGYGPLTRLPPGTFLAEQPEVQAVIAG